MLDLTLIRALGKSPGQVGTLLPSSRFLANRVLSLAVSLDCGGPIIEAGAGTGALTAALLAYFGPDRLTVIERDADLADTLRRRFPDLHIVHEQLEHVLGKLAPRPQNSVLVSSIPWRSLSAEQSLPIQRKLARYVIGGGQVIQFSYGRSAPFPAPDGAHWQPAGRVWLNVPPARLWVLSRIKQKSLPETHSI
ncbi:methyltransferase [Burkholderiaceae bacterium DAT-1]|nr:methyltransferase [Burkholderiaceae bacterium DAT-1]